jgi:hypothetical protein
VDEIKRTSGPQTMDGRRWEVQLSDTPSRDWLGYFKESSVEVLPQRVEFDRAAIAFRSDEAQVPHWVETIDRWIASTNAKHLAALERGHRARYDRFEAEEKERGRIRGLNERFKDL